MTEATNRYAGKIALVIGASGGVGFAVTRSCLALGMKVVGTFHNNSVVLDGLNDPDFSKIQFDFSENPANLVEKLLVEGRFPFLTVNCASVPILLKRFEDLGAEEISKEINASILGPTLLTQALIKGSPQGEQSTIVHILSQSAYSNPARLALYAMGKSALESLVKSVAKETLARGVRLIGISPPFIETQLLKSFPAKMLELERSRRPSKTLVQPREIAELVIDIITNNQKYKSGEIISIA